MSTISTIFQQCTKKSFKSDVAPKHALGRRPAKSGLNKERRRPRERKKQHQQLEQPFRRLFTKLCHLLAGILYFWKQNPVKSNVCLKIPVVFYGSQLECWASFWSFSTKLDSNRCIFVCLLQFRLICSRAVWITSVSLSILVIYQVSQILWFNSNSLFGHIFRG